MMIGVLMNQLLFAVVCELNLPIWLDVSGTVLAVVMLEPTAGLIVGLINNCYLSIFVYGSNSLLYYAISAAAALTMWRSGGIPTGNWETMFYEIAMGWQIPKVFACLFGTAIVKFLDIIAVVIAVIFCHFLLSKQWKEQYNYK